MPDYTFVLGGGSADGRGLPVIIGNSVAGDTSAICDYLDVGDGVQLKAGIEAAGGNPVYIRPGTYDFNNGVATSNKITIPVGTRVEGAGMDAVTIRVLDAATEGMLFDMQGDGTVLREFTISVPTPTAAVAFAGTETLIESTATVSGKLGLESVRIQYEDSGWSTLADSAYSGGLYTIYQGGASGPDEFFIRNCEFLDVPNFKSTPALQQTYIQPMYGQYSFFKIKCNFIRGGDLGFELAGTSIISGNILRQTGYNRAVRIFGGIAIVVDNEIELICDPGAALQYGIVCLNNIDGVTITDNDIRLTDGTHANTYAVYTGNNYVTVANNRFVSDQQWQYVLDVETTTEGSVVGNVFGSGYGVLGSASGLVFEGNSPNDRSTAIHDDVSGEISAITEKGTPVSADVILIEDSADSSNKKKIQVGNLPGGSGTDADAIHDNVAAEISAITAKATPTIADYLVIEDAADSDNKKSITIGDLPAATPDSHASSHDAGGGDAMAIDAVAGTGSLRTLGTSATSACAGNDSRLSDSRTPTSHASTHDAGGGDAMAIDAVAGTGSLRTLGTSATSACAGNDSRLSDSRTPTSHATSHESGGGDVIAHQDLSGAGTNDHSTIDTHLASSANPHTVTATQVGNTTAQWNADELQGTDIDASLAPTDGQVLTYDNGSSHWTASAPAEHTSYRELATNKIYTQATGSPETTDVGEGVFDASQHNSVTLRATLTVSWATTGTMTVKLWDDGPTSAPGTPRTVSTFTKTTDGGYEVFEQALTIVSSSPSTNEILGSARVYRIELTIDGAASDVAYIGSAGLVGVGNGDNITLNADVVQAIVMSLNA